MVFSLLVFAVIPVCVLSYSAGSSLTSSDCPECTTEIGYCLNNTICAFFNKFMVNLTTTYCLPLSDSESNHTLDFFASAVCDLNITGLNCTSNGFDEFYECAKTNNCLYSFPSSNTNDSNDPCQLNGLECDSCSAEQISCQSDSTCHSTVIYMLENSDCYSECQFGTYLGSYSTYYDCLSGADCLPTFGVEDGTDCTCDCTSASAACMNNSGCIRLLNGTIDWYVSLVFECVLL